MEHEEAISSLEKLLKEHHNNAELINEGHETAPSKRILKVIPEYNKVSVGAMLTELEGIIALKEKCKHFGDWIKTLEKLPSSG